MKRGGISGKVKFLHYEFDGWLGDELVESTPAFIVSSRLAEGLKQSEFKGFTLQDCLVTASDEFEELYPDIELPNFVRFIPQGTVELEGEQFKNWSGHDFCLSAKGELVVTEKALAFLNNYSINNCEIVVLGHRED
ncbi:hypothetical protein [Bacillus sp. FJAT-27225]|uniref:hypothetical protein n=1 Tax=Bacillus sp. FJAT-27225 TaxID=1743144 RepID=UPI0020C7D7B7|nr:hypothetical protein [Bacillus sp. FJAT-27225]